MSAVDVDSLSQPEEDFWQDATPSFSFDGVPPITAHGIVLSQQRVQQTDFESGDPMFWKDGRPRLKVVIELQCDPSEVEGNPTEFETADDDGKRMLHVRIPSGAYTAIKKGIKDAGRKTLRNGDDLTLTYARDGKKEKGKTAPKEFDALIIPANEPPF